MSWPVQALLAWVLSPGRHLDVLAVNRVRESKWTLFQEHPPRSPAPAPGLALCVSWQRHSHNDLPAGEGVGWEPRAAAISQAAQVQTLLWEMQEVLQKGTVHSIPACVIFLTHSPCEFTSSVWTHQYGLNRPNEDSKVKVARTRSYSLRLSQLYWDTKNVPLWSFLIVQTLLNCFALFWAPLSCTKSVVAKALSGMSCHRTRSTVVVPDLHET